MNRFVLILCVSAAVACPAFAVVARTVPLKDVLAAEQFIVTVRIETINASPDVMSIRVIEELKGKAPKSPWIVQLSGDSLARREQQAVRLKERIAAKTELIVFGSSRGTQTTLFAFTNGTWFQIVGNESAGYSFTHLEPYLRRTFRGTTAELKQTVLDVLSGRKAAPAPAPNEPPGLGPPLVKPDGGPR